MIHSSFILADATAQQVGIGLFVATGIMAFLWLGTQLKRAWFPKEDEKIPLPLPIQISSQFATKEELAEVKLEIRELEKALPETERRILSAIERSGEKITVTVNRMAEVATAGRRKLYDKSLVHTGEIEKLKTKAEVTDRDVKELRDFKNQF